MFKKILIVCVGNICRSPIGEVLLKEKLAACAPHVLIHSAGLAAMVNYPADKLAQEVMLERGLDISTHRARQITPALLLDSDLILTMETGHQEKIEKMLPEIRGRVHRLGKWSNFDIPDPYQWPKAIFEQVSALIEEGVNEWKSKLC
jgi:protein-tyrosine phosphatase